MPQAKEISEVASSSATRIELLSASVCESIKTLLPVNLRALVQVGCHTRCVSPGLAGPGASQLDLWVCTHTVRSWCAGPGFHSPF